jgi:hypothetical protein
MWHVCREEDCIRVLVEKPQGNKLPGSPTHRWEVTIKMDLTNMMGGHKYSVI